MEIQNKKCSLKEHSEVDAIIFCLNCKLNLCKECEVFHSNFCKDHQIYNIDAKDNEIFNEFCKEYDHFIKLEYFCRTHNILCCAKCIAKIKNEKNGKHTDCNICNIEDIVEEKKNKFHENIETLKELSDTIDESINEMKNIIDNFGEKKNEIKMKIQQSFIKIRTELNNKEDQLLSELDNFFDNTFFKEDIMEEIEKLPDKIKSALELDDEKDNNDSIENNKKEVNIISLIKDCLSVENYIKEINLMNEKIKKHKNLDNLQIDFIYNDETIIGEINNFGFFSRNILPEFLKSSIIKGDSKKQELIINWIKEKIKKEEINFELIFKMTENGSESKDFHEFCNDKGSTLTLISTTEGKKFGGFTSLNWKSEGGFVCDTSMETFLFSLNLGKKYDLNDKEKSSIKFDLNNGPSFGNGDIIVYQNMKDGKTYANEKSSFLEDYNLELIQKEGEQQSFNIQEIEVYRIIF